MTITQLIGTLIHKNLATAEIQGLLAAFNYDAETHGNPIEFLMENIIKAFISQYFSGVATQKMLTYFDYKPEYGDPISFLMSKVSETAEEIKEDNEFEEEMKMVEEEENRMEESEGNNS